MKRFKLERKFNQWQFVLKFRREPWLNPSYAMGWRKFTVGIVKIHTMPDEGQELLKRHYDGFIFERRVWLPFERV